MNRFAMLKVLNPIVLLVALFQAGTGIYLHYRGTPLMYDIHFDSGLFLVALILIHLALNWNWVMMNYFKRS